MIVLFFLKKYINRLDDNKFEAWYDKWLVSRFRKVLLGTIIYYFLGTILISELLMSGSEGVLLSILVFFATLIVYGLFYIRNVLMNYQLFNTRYMKLKMGMDSNTYTDFSRDNVVN